MNSIEPVDIYYEEDGIYTCYNIVLENFTDYSIAYLNIAFTKNRIVNIMPFKNSNDYFIKNVQINNIKGLDFKSIAHKEFFNKYFKKFYWITFFKAKAREKLLGYDSSKYFLEGLKKLRQYYINNIKE